MHRILPVCTAAEDSNFVFLLFFVQPLTDDFADRVAGLCLEKFRGLPGKGKPIAGKEWTLLSGVVQRQQSRCGGTDESRLKVVSLATGTKCLGANKLCAKGTVVNDSHAEVKRYQVASHALSVTPIKICRIKCRSIYGTILE